MATLFTRSDLRQGLPSLPLVHSGAGLLTVRREEKWQYRVLITVSTVTLFLSG